MTKEDQSRVLIVDDEKINLDVLRHILKDRYLVSIAKSGEAALRIARETVPDLILLDVMMPGLDGFEVIVRLKNEEATRKVPVIFITAMDDAESEEKGIRLGAADYIPKPFNPEVVRARVKNQLMISRQIESLSRMEMIDPRTNLPNPRRFDVLVRTEWRRAAREKATLTLIRIEATPHDDSLWRRVAEIVQTAAAASAGFAAMFDDARLALLFSNVENDEAATIAGELQKKIESVAPEGTVIGLAVVSVRPENELSVDRWLTSIGYNAPT